MRDFVGIDLSREAVPDGTTLLKFRRLLLVNDLTKALFDEINAHLAEQGLLMRSGTIVDATIIAPPSSTKSATGERDPEVHQAKKGNQGRRPFFGNPVSSMIRQPPSLKSILGTTHWQTRRSMCSSDHSAFATK